ncbi:MAG: hypothetical protein LC754_04265 [Acidobacteria bacterium]|nr:hypothetical protein [Acidobacteriota bacterium]
MAVSGEGAFGILLMEFAPLDNRVWMKLMLARGLHHTLARFDFAHDLEFELFGELASLEGHGCSPFARIPP